MPYPQIAPFPTKSTFVRSLNVSVTKLRVNSPVRHFLFQAMNFPQFPTVHPDKPVPEFKVSNSLSQSFEAKLL
jgi:hypothetical protein